MFSDLKLLIVISGSFLIFFNFPIFFFFFFFHVIMILSIVSEDIKSMYICRTLSLVPESDFEIAQFQNTILYTISQ